MIPANRRSFVRLSVLALVTLAGLALARTRQHQDRVRPVHGTDLSRSHGDFRNAQAGGDEIPPRIDSLLPAPGTWLVDNVGLTEVQISFDEDVIVPLDAVTVWTVGGGVVTGFDTSYDPASATLTVSFAAAIRDDCATVVVDYNVTDLAGNELDGEIADPSNASLPSGNGARGGQAVFRINILQGDANRDAVVDELDGQIIQASLGQCEGGAGFDPNADLNVDGCVNVLDVGIFTLAEGRSLPETDGAAPQIVSRTPDVDEEFMINELGSAVVVLSEAVRPESVLPSTLFAVLPSGDLQPAASVSLTNGSSVATFSFAPPLPTDALYQFALGNSVADIGGEFLSADPSPVWSATLVPPPPILLDGTALIIGRVFDAGTGEPIEGATINTWLFPRKNDEEPPLPPVAFTDAQGSFQYETVPFEGQEDFLVRIHKDGFAENLRHVEIMASRCWRPDDAFLGATNPPVPIVPKDGGMIMDEKMGIVLEIPPGALMPPDPKNPDAPVLISMTGLATSNAVRDKLPPLVIGDGVDTLESSGTYIDIGGVFGDQTLKPVTMRVPNKHNLPPGTRIRFGKIDHNTLEWTDLCNSSDPEVPCDPESDFGVGVVVPDGTMIEVQFDHFCTVVCNWCADPETPNCNCDNDNDNSDGGDGICGSATISFREGYLSETVSLPAFQEFGQPWGVALSYSSGAADPSVTLSARADYDSNRPIERTIFHFSIEGLVVEAAYDFSQFNVKHNATFFWNGRNALDELMPTGSYPLTIVITGLNGNSPVAISAVFGGPAVQSFDPLTYPGLTPLDSEVVETRARLVNLTDSPYGAGWSITNESRLYFDPDGCIVLVQDNANALLFVPQKGDLDSFITPDTDFTTLSRLADGSYLRTFIDGTEQRFSPAGRLTRIEDRNGYVTHYSYQNDLLTQITSPTGYFYELEYVAGKLSRIIDSAGRETLFEVDPAGDLRVVTDVLGSTRNFDYDPDHLLMQETGPRGERTEYDFDNGRVTETRAYDVDGTTLLRTRQFEHSAAIAEIGAALEAGLGTLQNPIPVVEHRVDTYIDGRGEASLHETDLDGFTSRKVDPLGRETLFVHDANGLLTAMTRPDGSMVEHEYDEFGNRTVQRELFNGAVTQFEFLGPFQQLTKLTDPRDNETSFTYLPNGSLSQITDALLNTTSFQYEDPSFPDLATTRQDALKNETTLTYDGNGNLLSLTDPLDRTTSFEHDERGNRSAVVDGRGERTEMSYDDNNRLTQILDALLQVTELQYDEKACGCQTDNVTRVVFPNLTEMEFLYDGLGRQIGETDQLGEQKSFSYDAESALTMWVNRNGEQIDFTYDASGQLIGKDLPGLDLTVFEYDALGNLSFVENSSSRLTFDYDGLGRLIGTTQRVAAVEGFVPGAAWEETLTYDYDLAGNRIEMTTSFGDFDYEYDDLDRLTTLTNPFLETWTFFHNDLGALAEVQLPNSLVSQAIYDQGLELSEISHETADGEQLVGAQYVEYDGIGNSTLQIASNSDGPSQSTYAYDALSRLDSSEVNPTPPVDIISVAATFDEANRIQADDEFTYTHDAEGRLVSKHDTAQSLTYLYQYNAEGQLIEYSEIADQGRPASLVEVQYFYDPLGRRVQKSIGGVSSRFFYDGSNRLADAENGGEATILYTSGLGIDEPLSRTDTSTSETFYYHQDRLGSVVALTDAIGDVIQEYEYEAFGNIVGQGGGGANPIAFTGRDMDSESGLYYYRARYYDSTVGRFMSEDPIGIDGGINLYTYVENNPINVTDPSGLSAAGQGQCSQCLNICDIAYCSHLNGCVDDCNKIPWWLYPARKICISACGITFGQCSGCVAGCGDICEGETPCED